MYLVIGGCLISIKLHSRKCYVLPINIHVSLIKSPLLHYIIIFHESYYPIYYSTILSTSIIYVGIRFQFSRNVNSIHQETQHFSLYALVMIHSFLTISLTPLSDRVFLSRYLHVNRENVDRETKEVLDGARNINILFHICTYSQRRTHYNHTWPIIACDKTFLDEWAPATLLLPFRSYICLPTAVLYGRIEKKRRK